MIIKPAVLEPRPAAARKQSRSRNRPRRGCSSPGQDLCKVNIAFGSPSGTEFSASTYRQGRSEPNRSLYSVCSAACGNRFFLLLAEGKLFSGSVILQDVPRILDGEKQGERRNILRHGHGSWQCPAPTTRSGIGADSAQELPSWPAEK